MTKLQFKVPGMACSACAATITKAVLALDASATVQADPETKWVTLETVSDEMDIRAAIVAAGYPIEA